MDFGPDQLEPQNEKNKTTSYREVMNSCPGQLEPQDSHYPKKQFFSICGLEELGIKIVFFLWCREGLVESFFIFVQKRPGRADFLHCWSREGLVEQLIFSSRTSSILFFVFSCLFCLLTCFFFRQRIGPWLPAEARGGLEKQFLLFSARASSGGKRMPRVPQHGFF